MKVEGSIRSQGVVVVSAALLRDITSSFSGTGSMTLEHAGDTAVITAGMGKSTLKTLPSEDFPIIPLPQSSEATLTIAGNILSSLLNSVVACASTSTVRPELASVLLSGEGGTLKAVASDSFRLAEKKISVEKTSKPFSILIPAKNASDILQTIPGDDLTLTLDEHQCAFAWKGGVVTTRLVAASYPDYTQIIPKSFSAEGTVLKKDFESVLKRTAVFSDTFQKVRIAFDVAGKQIIFASRNADVGETSEMIPASLSGDSLELSFNHRYLAAPLSLITAENVTISLSGIGRPLVMRGTGDASFLYLVMPMNQ